MSTWREHCSPIIASVISNVGTEDMKSLRRALREAYPYGVRTMWPYKVWCSEVRKQLGLDTLPSGLSKKETKAGQGALFPVEADK